MLESPSACFLTRETVLTRSARERGGNGAGRLLDFGRRPGEAARVQPGQGRRNADRRDDLSLRITDRRGDASDLLEIFPLVEREAVRAHLRAEYRETRH